MMMRDLRGVLEGRPDEVIRAVLDRSGYRQMLKDSRDEEDAERYHSLAEKLFVLMAEVVVVEPEREPSADGAEPIA